MSDLPRKAEIGDILRVEVAEAGRLTARLSGFGAETVGCAVRAAAATVEGKALHSVHACFVRPAPAERPVQLRVDTLSEGRRFARRRIEVCDRDRLVLDATLSFAAPAEGVAFLEAEMDPDAPGPEALPTFAEVMESEGWEDDGEAEPIDWRWIGRPWDPEDGATSRYLAWVRPMCAIPAGEPGLHAAAIAYLADYHSHWPVARKLGDYFDAGSYTSLDQTIWYHRPANWDDWFLLTSHAPVAGAGRSLGHRTLHDRSGRLVATMAQEALTPV